MILISLMRNCLTILLAALGHASFGYAATPLQKPVVKTVPALLPALPKAERLEANVSEIKLESRRAYRQLVVTAYFNGAARDVTQSAIFRVADEKIASLQKGRVHPLNDGNTRLTISFGDKNLALPISVSHFAEAEPIRFKSETVAALTKNGCSAGSCHGSPHGKGGFSLSLFGYDPRIDKVSLVRDGFNRRLDIMQPEGSLMLKKPLLEVSHGGGKKLRKTDTAYRVFRDWIYEGANVDLPAVECEKVVIFPGAARVLKAPFLQQQMSVLAYFSDGSARDVSALAHYESSHPDVAEVDADGLIVGKARGQAAISVRYLNALQSLYVTVIEDVKGFQWNNPVEINWVDKLVNEKLKQLQYLPSGTCRDDEFLRRVYLDLTGLLPTAEKTREFLKISAPDKRAKLIDALLDSEEFARFQALKKADLMRVSPRKLKDGRAELFSKWLIERVRQNTPYNQWTHALLTASGDTKKAAPANYYLAIDDEKERAEMTSQIFMGSRIECARCHNHPFENWTMRDYYSITAVFARTKAEKGEIKAVNSGEVLLPTSGERMKPWGLTDEKTQAKTDRRALFADWLTKPDNPLFARVEVNRIWADLIGRGIVEAVDDFRSSNPPSNVPLLEALAAEFIKSGYDRKHIMRLICNSQTYQRTTQTNDFNVTDETLFSHARVRLLSAEQLRDALRLATRSLPDAETIEPSLQDYQKRAEKRRAELENDYKTWLPGAQNEVAQLPLRAGGWFLAGPFAHSDFEKAVETALAPEKFPIDLSARFENSGWQLRPDLEDNRKNNLSTDNNQVHYLGRRIYSAKAQTLEVQIDPDERGRLWLNGKEATKNPFNNGQKVKLELQPGDNDLLLKIVNGGGEANFSFRADETFKNNLNLPPHAVEILALPNDKRSEEQKNLLHEAYFEADKNLNSLNAQITQLENRSDYATQRLYPADSTFATAFGQPKRETACTCERTNSPTLLQALELLNGDMAQQAASSGADKYMKFDDQKLIEELYLSALARFPTAKEIGVAKSFLAKTPDRKTAVTDLIWTVTNTREFLFQH